MKALHRFSQQFTKDNKPRPAAWLISELDQDVNHEHLKHAERDDFLEQLKTYTRNIEDAAPLCTRQGILLLCRHGFDHGTAKTSRTALKCLANVMLLNEKTRQIFVDLEYPGRAAQLYGHDNREDEFLTARILFLLTYGTNFKFTTLFNDKGLLDTINANLARYSKYFDGTNQRKRMPSVGDAASPVVRPADQKAMEAADQMANMALGETLKLLFNLANFYPAMKPRLNPSLLPVLKLLQRLKLQSLPLQPPITYLINALLVLEFDGQKQALFPTFDAKCNVDRLLLILDLALIRMSDVDLEHTANPLITLLRKLYEMTPGSPAPKGVRTHLQAMLLPSTKDRDKPLGQSDSMPSRLLRLSNKPATPTLGRNVQELLFELSGRDPTRFVQNVGYGFAAGFLVNHGMSVSSEALDAARITEVVDGDEDENDEDGQGDGAANVVFSGGGLNKGKSTEGDKAATSRQTHSVPVNPITGQRVDMEESDEEDTRTEDEKIREAERLFVLFERLRATGVVDIENPVTKAAREGRLQ